MKKHVKLFESWLYDTTNENFNPGKDVKDALNGLGNVSFNDDYKVKSEGESSIGELNISYKMETNDDSSWASSQKVKGGIVIESRFTVPKVGRDERNAMEMGRWTHDPFQFIELIKHKEEASKIKSYIEESIGQFVKKYGIIGRGLDYENIYVDGKKYSSGEYDSKSPKASSQIKSKFNNAYNELIKILGNIENMGKNVFARELNAVGSQLPSKYKLLGSSPKQDMPNWNMKEIASLFNDAIKDLPYIQDQGYLMMSIYGSIGYCFAKADLVEKLGKDPEIAGGIVAIYGEMPDETKNQFAQTLKKDWSNISSKLASLGVKEVERFAPKMTKKPNE